MSLSLTGSDFITGSLLSSYEGITFSNVYPLLKSELGSFSDTDSEGGSP